MAQVNDLRAKYNASGNAVIPNTFQHPNIFVDKLMAALTPEENVVLTFAVRRILGFQSNIMSRKDNISLSQFTDGITAEDGRILSAGCGLGTNAVRKALDSLELFKILMPTTNKPNPKLGQEYWLQENENSIEWELLEQRTQQKKVFYANRTTKARYVVAQKGVVGQKAKGTVAQKAKVLSDNNTKPIETQETHINDNEHALSTLSRLYSDNIGAITPLGADLLRNISIDYPEAWYEPAMKVCIANNARNLNYFETVLRNMKEKGLDWKPEKYKQNKAIKQSGSTPLDKALARMGAD